VAPRYAEGSLAQDEGHVIWSGGNYADYEADRKKRPGAEADRPHRLRYKRLK